MILGTTNGGATLRETQSTLDSTASMNGIACASTSDCEAVAEDSIFLDGLVFGTTDGGKKWKAQSIPTGSADLVGVASAPATTCEAVGAGPTQGVALRTIAGGTTWKLQTLPTTIGLFDGMSCRVAGHVRGRRPRRCYREPQRMAETLGTE